MIVLAQILQHFSHHRLYQNFDIWLTTKVNIQYFFNIDNFRYIDILQQPTGLYFLLSQYNSQKTQITDISEGQKLLMALKATFPRNPAATIRGISTISLNHYEGFQQFQTVSCNSTCIYIFTCIYIYWDMYATKIFTHSENFALKVTF